MLSSEPSFPVARTPSHYHTYYLAGSTRSPTRSPTPTPLTDS